MLLTSAAIARSAHAQIDAGAASGKDDLTTLEKKLTDETTALTTSDCSNACRALASIRRAALKICALDPEARCVAARAKADEAARRVRDACPDCAIAANPLPESGREERAMGNGAAKPAAPEPVAEADSPKAQAANAPPSESKKGGCASCTTSAVSPSDFGSIALAMGALAFVLRRRRASTRDR